MAPARLSWTGTDGVYEPEAGLEQQLEKIGWGQGWQGSLVSGGKGWQNALNG